MATEQRFDSGMMLAYRDTETKGSIVFAVYDNGQWSQWHEEGLTVKEYRSLSIPDDMQPIASVFSKAWCYERLQGTLGRTDGEPKAFVGEWRKTLDGFEVEDSIGRVLFLHKGDLQTWQYVRMEPRRADWRTAEMEF